MDGSRDFLEAVRDKGLVAGHLRGFLHTAIGRKVTAADGTPVSAGLTWRELANLLKQLRFDPELVREIGADPDTLSPRDRDRFWFAAIAAAQVDSAEAYTDAEKLVAPLKAMGYVVGPPASTPPPKKKAALPPPPPPPERPKGGKGKKKK